jgi:glutathione S-transferase
MSGLNDTHALLVSVLRGGRGWFTAGETSATQPEQLLEIYEFEACPYCRKVREVLSELDIEYVSRVVARGSHKRDELRSRGGKVQMPYLVDPNRDVEMYESEDIIDYLHAHYGSGRSIAWRLLSPFNTISASIATAVRPFGGRAKSPREKQPDVLLELYNFEASPYCRKVREVLNELDLDYRVRSVAKRGRRRADLVELGGRMMVPYLVDANNDVAMYESDDIVAYLRQTYGSS